MGARWIIIWNFQINKYFLVLSNDYGVYYVNHVEKKTQYEAPSQPLQVAKRASQTTPPIPEPNDQYQGKFF